LGGCSTLAAFLERFFPVIGGPHELHRVVPLLEERGGDFCASLRTDPEMVALTCRAGFLPMSEDVTGREVLLIKSHEHRCVLDPEELHVSRSTRRRARGLLLRIDYGFDSCLAAIVDYHADRWLSDSLCAALVSLHRAPLHGVRARSVELYAGRDLIAGEVGYTCGGVYTSMAGFHVRSGAGSVQLAALGVVLRRAGFVFWDLGMEMEYKRALGARVVARRPFLERYRAMARMPTPELPDGTECTGLL
jgi:Leu/Phe-tRNA-protein transferase